MDYHLYVGDNKNVCYYNFFRTLCEDNLYSKVIVYSQQNRIEELKEYILRLRTFTDLLAGGNDAWNILKNSVVYCDSESLKSENSTLYQYIKDEVNYLNKNKRISFNRIMLVVDLESLDDIELINSVEDMVTVSVLLQVPKENQELYDIQHLRYLFQKNFKNPSSSFETSNNNPYSRYLYQAGSLNIKKLDSIYMRQH